MINFLIAFFVAVATGIFAWLFLERILDGLHEIKESISSSASTKFSQMFVFIDISLYFNLYIAVIVILPIFVAVLSGKILLGILSLFALFAVPPVLIKILIRKRLKKFEQQLPDALLMIANSLKSGVSLTSAIDVLVSESPAPISQEFSLLLRERKLGVDIDTALAHMEERIPLEDFSLAISAIRISREVGGNLSEILESLAATVRRRLTMEGKIKSLTAQGKLQGIVMSSLPILLVMVLTRVEPAAMDMMFTTRLGWVVLALIVIMQFLGFLAIRKIVSIDV